MVELLLDNGADPNIVGHCEPPLQAAAESGYLDIVNLLLESGADINAGSKVGTELHVAAQGGCIDDVRTLLNRGADANAVGASLYWSKTALQVAAEGGRSNVLKILFDYGANVNAAPPENLRTALEEASRAGYFDVVKLVLTPFRQGEIVLRCNGLPDKAIPRS